MERYADKGLLANYSVFSIFTVCIRAKGISNAAIALKVTQL